MRGTTSPSRGNLHALGERIDHAERALEVLQRRRDVLLLELQDALDEYQHVQRSLSGTYEEAQQRASTTRAMEGEVALRGAARARSGVATVERGTRRVMGIDLPTFHVDPLRRTPATRGYGIIGTSGAIDETAAAYETLLERIVRAAEVEVAVRRLLHELTMAVRRVNGLQHRLLPDLREQHREMARTLEEREREAIVIRKWVKEHIFEDEDDSPAEDGSYYGLWADEDEAPRDRDVEAEDESPTQRKRRPRASAVVAGAGAGGPSLDSPHTAERWAAEYFDRSAEGTTGDDAEASARATGDDGSDRE